MDKKEEKLKKYMDKFTDDYEPESLTEEDKEFQNYCKLYEEKFGKQAYIAELGGSKAKTIEAIKICLEKNTDMLDELLYSKLKKDMKHKILY